jgi:hypothetical protein
MGKIVDAILYLPESTIDGNVSLFSGGNGITIGCPPEYLTGEDRSVLFKTRTKIIFFHDNLEYLGLYHFHGKADTNFVFDCSLGNIYSRRKDFYRTKYTVNFELKLQGKEGALFKENMCSQIPNLFIVRGGDYISGEFTLTSSNLSTRHLIPFLSHLVYSYSKYSCTITIINHETGKMETSTELLDTQNYVPMSNYYTIQGWQNLECIPPNLR